MNRKIMLLSAGLIIAVFLLSACKPIRLSGLEALTTVPSGQNEPQYDYQPSDPYVTVPQVTNPQVIVPDITAPTTNPTTEAPTGNVTENPTNPAVTVPSQPSTDYSSYSKAEIIGVYRDALNKTRDYKGKLTVDHTESFTADIKEANPGGALTELLASNIVKLVGSEGQQTLSYQNGTATNADGESVPILLPQRTSFSLPEEGVANALISEENGRVHVKLTLVSETVSMGQVPKYNSASIGYLDTSDMDFKIITISRVDIGYTGSVIDAYIRPDGYIDSVTYTINMSTYAELSGMGISGYGVLEGAQTEKWKLNW